MLKNTGRYRGALLILGGIAASAAAQDADQVTRVTVTGSSIKRIDAETAFPVTVIKADEFISKGMTSVEEVLTSLSMNQQSTVAAGNVGTESGGKSSANLRGLGDGRTLVLLNGRRLANHPYDGSSADLYSIPFAAIDRIEVLRDGASHIYGTDAISGVINFITKRSVTATTVTTEAVLPQHSGAREKRASLTAGFGDLDKDGYNIFGALDHHMQERMKATERAFSSTGILPEKGISKTSGTTFPANFFSANGITGNPGVATGCDAPDSIPDAAKRTCREDYARFVDGIPETRQTSFLGKGTVKLGPASVVSLEYLHSESDNINRIAPPPMTGLVMHSTSKWYPGGTGGTPAVAGLTGEDLNVSWRTTEGGRRQASNLGRSDRIVAALTGTVADWDYIASINTARTTVSEELSGGYLNDVAIQNGVNSGVLNPFGLQDSAGAALLASAQVRGEVVAAKARNTGLDLRLTRDLMELPAGPLGFSAGAEGRRENSEFVLQRGPLDQMMISRASGLVNAKDNSGSRSLSAVFAEANVPVTKALELQLATRYDRYSDAGNTFNPKIGFRFQPSKKWLLRGSANSGFRAPTLYELNGPVQDSITATQYSDPLLCPGGVAKPGVNPNISCNMNLPTRLGGNPQLKPERSRSYSFGVLAEPVPSLNLSLDLSKIVISEVIGTILLEETILGDFDRYRERYHYNSAGTALDYINVSALANGGRRMTQVADVTAQWRLPASGIGSFDAWFNGSYVMKDTFQDSDGATIENIGVYNGAVRWRHNAALRWSQDKLSVTLSQHYSRGYVDQNLVADQYKNHVRANSVWTLAASYTGFQNLTLSGGIKNVLDTKPPFSNQTPNPQTGYDPRVSNPVGRACYLRATYKF
ncbi:MAG: TonB-dependent receptor [Pseudomonadota bacterium]|nr:TonB-dependent receptor [Pseudomonadota bacterium]